MDLSTTYLGLRLRSPLVASAGPLTGRVASLQALEGAGIAAVVLPSLFEEQIVHDELQTAGLFDAEGGGNPEADSYFPVLGGFETLADRYLRHVEEARAALSVPVIGSLNGMTPGGWTRYARRIADAGADALELNLYRVAADPDVSAAEVEAEQIELVAAVADSVSIPLAVKLGPAYTALASHAQGLAAAGADGLVLFNRFYQPDIDPLHRQVTSALELSTSTELRLPLRWTGLLYDRVDADFAISTGVHTGLDAARCLLAGAQVAMMTSALLQQGPAHVSEVERELVSWAETFEVDAIGELRGSVTQRTVRHPEVFERANYIETLIDYADSFHSAQGGGPW
jgi:dihydroorotate dehydrogenase (fumarate)